MTKRKTDFEDDQYDSPWKEIIEEYFQDFMTFFFPKAAQEIDWSKGYEFLDKEFQKVVREASSKQGRVDKLVKVWRKTGEQAWVYIHIDVQSLLSIGLCQTNVHLQLPHLRPLPATSRHLRDLLW